MPGCINILYKLQIWAWQAHVFLSKQGVVKSEQIMKKVARLYRSEVRRIPYGKTQEWKIGNNSTVPTVIYKTFVHPHSHRGQLWTKLWYYGCFQVNTLYNIFPSFFMFAFYLFHVFLRTRFYSTSYFVRNGELGM